MQTMFTTFSARINPVTTPVPRGSESTIPSKIGKVRKRKVMRACDSCRVNRVKCDDEPPCQNCRNRGEKCTTSMPWEAHSLQAAKREIERLQEQLKELKEKETLQSQFVEIADHTAKAPRSTSYDTLENATEKRQNRYGRLQKTNDTQSTGMKEAIGEQMDMVHHELGSDLDSLDPFIPCRILSFNQRMRQCLEHAPTQSHVITQLEPTRPHLEHSAFPPPVNSGGKQPELSRAKERHLLSLFWQGFEFMCPILDRNEVQNHHDSLWSNAAAAGCPSSTRLPSALIDIILALSMQFSSSFLIYDDSARTMRGKNPGTVDSSVAGQWLYDRTRRLLLEEQQDPTLQSILSSMLLTLYILNTGSLNLAMTSLALSVRTAQILNIHEDSTALELNVRDREVRRNTWRSLVALDGYLATVMGLPPLLHQPRPTLTLPMNFWHSTSVLFTSGNDENVQNDVIAAFQIFHTKLTMILTSVHSPLCARQMKSQHCDAYGGDSRDTNLDSPVGCIAQKLMVVRDWIETIPPVLTIPRKGNSGEPFYPLEGPSLILDPNIPLWLQRQRLIFEVTYNHLNLIILRQFVHFEKRDSSRTVGQANSYSVIGLRHAISLTFIVSQAFTEGDALTGWHVVIQCQWDATLYILGYILANPASPLIPEARRSVSVAIGTFSILEKYLCAASSALELIREILNRISTIANPRGVILSARNRMLAPSRKSSSASAAGFLSGSPCSTNSEYYTITPGLTSPQLSSWDSFLQSPFDPTRGSAGAPYLSQPGNQEHVDTFPLSIGEMQDNMPLGDAGIGGVLNDMVFDGDWHSFMMGF
ncbi:fungal-specific transcription factor domain-containing protein [Hypoxylon sp. FL1857]|nr:fungal-specific transcription factor domain-containing protein [Hypoxylon sp. FL1857]